MLYGCDFGWWNANDGVSEFKGLKLSQDATVCGRYPDVHKVEVERGVNTIVIEKPGHLGSGQNSGFQSLNLAIQFGAKRIVIVGYDMRLGDGGEVHWHGPHSGLTNPSARTLERWLAFYEGLGKRLHELGVEVINASPSSAITVFAKMSVEDVLKRWGV